MSAKLSLVMGLLAAVVTVGVELLLDRYRLTSHWSDYAVMAFAAGPYLVLGSVAWVCRRSRPASAALLGATALLAAGGLSLIGMEWYGFHQAVTESRRGPEYMVTRYQRMAIFFVPLVQWLGALALGFGLLGLRFRSRREAADSPAAPGAPN